jgi:hypothetical protein
MDSNQPEIFSASSIPSAAYVGGCARAALRRDTEGTQNRRLLLVAHLPPRRPRRANQAHLLLFAQTRRSRTIRGHVSGDRQHPRARRRHDRRRSLRSIVVVELPMPAVSESLCFPSSSARGSSGSSRCGGDGAQPYSLIAAWQGGASPLRSVRLRRAACALAPIGSELRDGARGMAFRARPFAWQDDVDRVLYDETAWSLARPLALCDLVAPLRLARYGGGLRYAGDRHSFNHLTCLARSHRRMRIQPSQTFGVVGRPVARAKCARDISHCWACMALRKPLLTVLLRRASQACHE